MSRRQKPVLGTVISGTMRHEDLIPALVAELETYKPREAKRLLKYYGMEKGQTDEEFYSSQDADWLLEALQDALNDIAPLFAYFGSHEGDGGDYGFWISCETIQDITSKHSEYLRWDDSSRNPNRKELQGYSGYYTVTEHGNLTVYSTNYKPILEIV